MQAKNRCGRLSSRATIAAALTGVLALAVGERRAMGAALVWGGGGSDSNWSTLANWTGAAAIPANTDTLTFGGSTRLNPNNDIAGLTLGSNSITFAGGAGAFDVGGLGVTLGANNGGGYDVITKVSTNDQTISANLTLGGGGGDRRVVMTGGGTLALSGSLNFSNSWLFPNTTAGTIQLSGNNSGDGKGSVIAAGTNQFRATIGNNVANTQLVLGSDSALGNAGLGDLTSGGATLRGIQARQNTLISTVGDRNLSAYAIAISAANVTFNGSSNMTIGHIVNQGANRDFWVTSSGAVTVSSGLIMSQDQTGRTLYVNLTGTGGLTVNGKLFDTLHSSGLTTGSSILRKAGVGTLALNGDSTSTFYGVLQVEAGTVKIGHGGALGASDGTSATATQLMGGTLDVNGQTTGEYVRVLSTSTLVNSAAAAASMTANADLNGNLTVNLVGDLTATRLVGLGATRTITKLGNGTLTTNGSSHNNLSNWDIQAGTVVLANTSGFGADRGVTLNGGTLQLSGANSNLINNGESFTVNSGTFDLNGKGEAVASIGGTGGTVTNSAAGPATLFVGGGVSGTSSASFAGVIQDGSGVLNLTKEGTGTQTLTGVNTYSGNTTIAAGTLALGGSGTIANSAAISVAAGATFDVSGASSFTLSAGQTLSGSGTVLGSVSAAGTLAPGSSVGTLTLGSTLTLLPTAEYEAEFDTGTVASDLIAITGDLNLSGSPTLTLIDLAITPVALAPGQKFTLATYTGAWNGGTFASLADDSQFVFGPNKYTINYNDVSGATPALTLVVTPIPEPATAFASVLMVSLCTLRRRA